MKNFFDNDEKNFLMTIKKNFDDKKNGNQVTMGMIRLPK